jgi:hypothetical protein
LILHSIKELAVRRNFLSVLSLSFLVATACSSPEKSDSGNSDPTKKNTANEKEYIERAADVEKFYDPFADMKSSTISLTDTHALLDIAKPTEVPGGTEAQEAGDFIPPLEEVQNCEQAFSMIDQMYLAAKNEFHRSVEQVKRISENSPEGMDLTRLPLSEQDAFAYKLEAGDSSMGINAVMEISGGANDEMLTLRQKEQMKMDMSGMGSPMPIPGGMPVTSNMDNHLEFVADLKEQSIEVKIDAQTSQGKAPDETSMAVTGKIRVSVGDQKHVQQDLSIESQMGVGEKFAATVRAHAVMLDEGTLNVMGSIKAGDSAGSFSYTLKRTDQGCVVEDPTFEIPNSIIEGMGNSSKQ